MHRSTILHQTILAVLPSLTLPHPPIQILILRMVPKSQLTRSRSRSTAHAHAYSPDIPEEPPQIDIPRPVISTKYRSTPSKTSPTNNSFLPPQAMPSTAVHPTALNTTSMPSIRRAQTEHLPPRPHTNGTRKRKLMKVEYAFDAESDSEMSIVPGETVSVIEEVDPGWFIGEIVGDESRQGMFPATYCTVIESTSVTVSPVRETPPAVRRSLKPPSSTKEDDLEEQVSQLSLRRPATTGGSGQHSGGRPSLGRAVTASPTPSIGSHAAAKKKPPPPAPRGSKPASLASTGSSTAADTRCRECGCDEFRANVFKKGSCNNCFHVHIPV
jgi:hypothetical protein